jgi:hypothetical protein
MGYTRTHNSREIVSTVSVIRGEAAAEAPKATVEPPKSAVEPAAVETPATKTVGFRGANSNRGGGAITAMAVASANLRVIGPSISIATSDFVADERYLCIHPTGRSRQKQMGGLLE